MRITSNFCLKTMQARRKGGETLKVMRERVWKAKGDESFVRRMWTEWTLHLVIGGLFLLGPQGDRNTAFSVPLTCKIENMRELASLATLGVPDPASPLNPRGSWIITPSLVWGLQKESKYKSETDNEREKDGETVSGVTGETRYALLHQNVPW